MISTGNHYRATTRPLKFGNFVLAIDLDMCGGAQVRAGEHASLLMRLAIAYHPPRGMPALRVVMGPMNNTAFFIPNVLTVEANGVAYLKLIDPRSDVDVVCNENGLS